MVDLVTFLRSRGSQATALLLTAFLRVLTEFGVPLTDGQIVSIDGFMLLLVAYIIGANELKARAEAKAANDTDIEPTI